MIQKPWRERVAAAEKRRGHRFIRADIKAWNSPTKCCVGEYALPVAQTLGIGFMAAWHRLNGGPCDFSEAARWAIFSHDPQKLSRILDQIEDRALELKRTHGATED